MLQNDCYDNIKEFFSPSNSDQINIMTSHKSKGLEFDVVFISHLYGWLVPAGNEMTDQAKNLHYVSITRGKKACFLCYSTQRHRKSDNKVIPADPSPFLQDSILVSYRKKIKWLLGKKAINKIICNHSFAERICFTQSQTSSVTRPSLRGSLCGVWKGWWLRILLVPP